MKKKVITLLLLILTAHISVSQTRTELLDEYLSQLFEEDDFNGSVLIAEKGEIIYQKQLGYSNIENETPLNENSIFELASVSKQFTAMGIMLLQKQGKLNFDDKVSKFIPELKDYDLITIRHLVHHTGGLPDYMDLMSKHWDTTKIANNNDMIKLFQKLKPKVEFEANEKFQYSNTGYALLASIIEKASGNTFGTYLKKNIFEPLGMKNTFVNRRRYNPRKIENLTEGHIFSKQLKKLVAVDKAPDKKYFYYLDGFVGDGMVKTTINDMLIWDRALYTNKLVSDADKNIAFNGTTLNNGEKTNYGFGWFLKTLPEGNKTVYHSGGWAGYITYLERQMETDKTIVILLNTSYTSLPNRKKIRHIINNTWINLDKKALDKYSGNYKSKDSTTIEILNDGKRLFYNYKMKTKLELIPNTKEKFDLEGFRPLVTLDFKFNPNGEIESVRMQQEGQGIDETYQKID